MLFPTFIVFDALDDPRRRQEEAEGKYDETVKIIHRRTTRAAQVIHSHSNSRGRGGEWTVAILYARRGG